MAKSKSKSLRVTRVIQVALDVMRNNRMKQIAKANNRTARAQARTVLESYIDGYGDEKGGGDGQRS